MKLHGEFADNNCNGNAILNKVQKQINIWSRFNLSLVGRISIAKTMMYSQLNYIGCFLPLDTEILVDIESKITKYVTGNMRVSSEKIFASQKHGGLGLFPLKEFLGAQQCAWILRSRTLDELWKIELNLPVRGDLDHLCSATFDNHDYPLFSAYAKQWEKFYDSFSKTNFLNVMVLNNKALTLHLRTRDFLIPESFDANLFQAHKDQIEKLHLKKLFNNRGEILSLEHFSQSTNLPVNVAMHNKLKKILETAITRYCFSGSDTTISFFRMWRKGSGKIQKVMLWEKSNREISHNMVKFSETTDTVINFETAKLLNTQWTKGYFSPAQRAFFYKLHNNTLGINTRLSHFIRDIDRNCEFCNITQVAEQDDETILHFFLTARLLKI
jgi:hypothetical protein